MTRRLWSILLYQRARKLPKTSSVISKRLRPKIEKFELPIGMRITMDQNIPHVFKNRVKKKKREKSQHLFLLFLCTTLLGNQILGE